MAKLEKQIDSAKKESASETSGIKKIIKEILTKESVRNSAALVAFIPTTMSPGTPWCCS